jgi:predicted transcriptional regulator
VDTPKGNTRQFKVRLEPRYREALRRLAQALCPPRGMHANEANAIRALVEDAEKTLEKKSR